MTEIKKIAEAQFSSAGDDFHVRWTIKKCLDLLSFDDNRLTLITVENTELNFAKKADPEGKNLLGVDLVEYYGGKVFETADSVVISQVKYGTRRATTNYTFSELYKGKKGASYDGSIIHRFAQLFKVFLKQYERDIVLEKIKIKLISNRNINSSHENIIIDIQKELNKNIQKKGFKTLKSTLSLSPSNEKALDNLKEASKLNSTEFTDFLRVLDFSDCGEGSRNYQKLETISALCKLGATNPKTGFNDLFQLVWGKMMPESEEHNDITKEDVLFQLGISQIEDLFPVNQKFEQLGNIVEREQINEIIKEIVGNNKTQPICLHGGAGIGKSTIVNSISSHLPKYYECILFDCYGAGEYLNSSDKRHSHKNALLHLSNEMARNIGSDLLLLKNESAEVYIREFKRRAEEAVAILKKRNPESKLVIIVDAVDNSITAAEGDNSTSFIQDLLNEPLPVGCELIVTFRTYRKKTLKLPFDYIDIPIKPFSKEETGKYLATFFKRIKQGNIDEFHKRTGGIPRVQSYSIQPTVQKTLTLLKPKEVTTVENLIEVNIKEAENKLNEFHRSKLIEAEKKIGKREPISRVLKYLISLPRPVPLKYIEECSKLDKDIIKGISIDIWGGLVLNDDQFSFNDEDFENFIRLNYKPTATEIESIANMLLKYAETDEYASINLGNFLYSSNKTEDLKLIVLNKQYLEVPKDIVRNKEVYIDRTKLAMSISNKSNDNVSFFKLTLIAAEQAKTDSALKNILRNNLDLTNSYSDSITLRRILLDSSENSWFGAIHYQLAAINSRKTETIEQAKAHFKSATDWMNWRNRQIDSDKDRKYPITEADIAYGGEVIYRIDGFQAALKWIKGWRPKEMLEDIVSLLADIIFESESPFKIQKQLQKVKLRTDLKIILLNKSHRYYSSNQIIDREQVLNDLQRISSLNMNFKQSFLIQLITFLEHNVKLKIGDNNSIISILDMINVAPIKSVPNIYGKRFHSPRESQDETDLFLRKEALKAVLEGNEIKIKDFYPHAFNSIEKEEDHKKKELVKKDKKEFDQYFKHAIPIYQYRAERLNHNPNKGDEFKDICKRIANDHDFRYYGGYNTKYKLNFLANLMTEEVIEFRTESSIKSIINSFSEDQANYMSLRFEILEQIINTSSLQKQCLTLLNEIENYIEKSTFPANEVVDYFIECSKMGRHIDIDTGKYYFDKAIHAVSEIDIEAQDQIKCIYNLSKIGLPKPNPVLAYQFSRFIEYSNEKLGGYDHFPIREGVKGIANIDVLSSFSVLCRWNHRYVLDILDYTVSVLNISKEKGFIQSDIASSLLPLNPHHWIEYIEYCSLLLDDYSANGDYSGKNHFVKNLIHDLKLANITDKSEDILTLIEDGRYLDAKLIQDLSEYVSFIKNINSSESHPKIKHVTKKETLQKPDAEPRNADITSTRSIEQELNNIKGNEDLHFGKFKVDKFLVHLKNQCSVENYTKHLSALIDINPDLITFYSFNKALEERLNDWSISPSVREWKKLNFEDYLKKWFSSFNWGDGINIWQIQESANLFSVTDIELSKIILKILPEKINILSASSIYQSIEIIQNTLTKKDNEEIMTWALDEWNLKIKEEFGDGLWTDKLIPGTNSNTVIALTLRHVLGDPDKRKRWRAIHSIRRLVVQGNVDVLETLLQKQNDTDCSSFQTKTHQFYWISAKLYLWIAIERISKENPNILFQFSGQFYNELIDNNLPHTLIKYFIKQTCINLLSIDDSLYSDKETNIILNYLESKLPPIDEKKQSKQQRRKRAEVIKDWKFKFDGMDTLPYWYNNLAALFNLSEYDVADIADTYISQKWGYVGNPNEDDYVETYNNSDWHLTGNRQGSIPVIETLKKYYEYHGMYCAAGELLEKKPLLKTDDELSWGSWKYWLESKAYSIKNYWLSDLIDPLPLEGKFWKSEFPKFDNDWKSSIREEQYDNAIGIYKSTEDHCLTLHADYTRYFGENYESVSICSALVSLKTSEALLRTLQYSKNHYDYLIPLENNDKDITDSNFQLLGWLREIKTDHEGLDKDDPFGNILAKNYIELGQIVRDSLNISSSMDSKQSFFKNESISSYQCWDVTTDQKRYDGLESSGNMFKVKMEFLLSFLSKINKGLIVECHINRQLKERDYSFDVNQYESQTKIYLIQPDGKIKTIRGGNIEIR